jgi:hypothetical protein
VKAVVFGISCVSGPDYRSWSGWGDRSGDDVNTPFPADLATAGDILL